MNDKIERSEELVRAIRLLGEVNEETKRRARIRLERLRVVAEKGVWPEIEEMKKSLDAARTP